MKTILKQLITIKSIPVLALVLLVVLGSSFVKGTAQDPEPGFVYSADAPVTDSIAGKLHATISFYSVEDDIAAIEDVLNQYAVTANAGDFEGWLSLHADDVVKMPPDAPAIFGKEDLRANFKPFFDDFNTSCVLYPEEAQVDGDMGLARGTYSISATPKAGGETIDIMTDGKYLTICKRQADGSWKISHDCYNSNIPPAQ
jgi:uncharacterized protein (TIGR02246 family)